MATGKTWDFSPVSRLSDIITALGAFGTRYDARRWLTFLQAAIPGLTEQDARWLVSLPAPVDSPLPAPLNQHKRKASIPAGLDTGSKKRLPAPQSVSIRRSLARIPTPPSHRWPLRAQRPPSLSPSLQATTWHCPAPVEAYWQVSP